MKGIVVAPQPLAVHVGADVLRDGGNAFDAAVATAFAQSVVEPQMCGVGGWGMSLVWPAGEPAPMSLDFYGRAPQNANRDVYLPYFRGVSRIGGGFILQDHINEVGYLSVTVPGLVKGLHTLHCAYGRKAWSEVVLPAAEAAESGVRVPEETYRSWVKETTAGFLPARDKLVHSEESRRIFTKGGTLYQPGELILQQDYANTLREIAETGSRSFYHGRIAEVIASDFARNGGLITADDLAEYAVTQPDPLIGSYRGYDIFTNQPPGGGLQVLQILNVLENFDLSGLRASDPQYVHLLIQAMWLAFEDRRRHHGDPEFTNVPVGRLASKGYAAELADAIDLDAETLSLAHADVPVVPEEPTETTHVSVADAEGNAVSITHTLGSASGVVTPGLGFTYNNSMHLFDPRPGSPNSLEPRKRRITGMAPTIVSRDGKPFLIAGAPGGTRIITAIVHTIVNIVDHGMSPGEAVSAPRFHAENGLVFMEPRGYYSVASELERFGYEEVTMVPSSFDPMLGRATVVRVDPDGEYSGGSDPRGGGGLEQSRV